MCCYPTLYRLKELTNANEKLRAQVTDKDHSISMLQMSISSLENRLGAMAAREQQQLERPLGAPAPASDVDDTAYDALHSIARQLIQDSDQVRQRERTLCLTVTLVFRSNSSRKLLISKGHWRPVVEHI
jgi:hypothetical protein